MSALALHEDFSLLMQQTLGVFRWDVHKCFLTSLLAHELHNCGLQYHKAPGQHQFAVDLHVQA